jgi:SWI/SNF-related matrix-associated actin-dependent regulator 1 of chromatin subfamily A
VPHLIDHINYIEFGKTYCAGFYISNKARWDFTGASNMPALALRIKDVFMLRIRKSEVLKDLPPKIEQVVMLAADLPPTLLKMEKSLRARPLTDLMRPVITAAAGETDLHLASYRRLLGVHKIPLVLSFIKSVLEDSPECALVFCQHREVAAALVEGLQDFRPLLIVGDTPTSERQRVVDNFQNPHSLCRVLIGNIQAMGVGFTLTRATRVIFAEFSYVPGENTQAADRAHRIGQKKSVVVNYCVYKNSLDRYILSALQKKSENIQEV